MDDADQCIANLCRMERLEDRHGVSSPAAARIVGDVGEDHGGCGRACEADGFVQAGQCGAKAVAALPAGHRNLPRQRVGRRLIGRGDHDREAIEGRIGIGKPAHDRDIQHAPGIRRLSHPLLAEVDQLAIRPVGSLLAGELRYRRRHDWQADASQEAARSVQQPAQQARRLGAAFAHVEVRIGAVADEAVQQSDIGFGHIGMQVEGSDNRHLRPEDTANQRQ